MSSGLPDDPAQVIDLLGEPTISGELAAHPFACVQDRRVMTAEPVADLYQGRAQHHLKAQQYRDMPGKDDARQVTPTQKLAAPQTKLLGDDVHNELGR